MGNLKNIVGIEQDYKDRGRGRYIPLVFLLCSWASSFEVPISVPSKTKARPSPADSEGLQAASRNSLCGLRRLIVMALGYGGLLFCSNWLSIKRF